MLYHDPAAKTHDRLGFTLTIAIALHVAVILGVGFAMTIPKAPNATRMDITLSHHASDKAVLDADFLAQTNQEASGTESDKAELTTTDLAPINSPEPQPILMAVETPKTLNAQSAAIQVVTTENKSTHSVTQELTELVEEDNQLDGENERLLRQLEMASLHAKLAEQEQLYARLPRIRRSSSVATKASVDAEYLYNWQRRIESIGNQHYPAKARDQQLVGDVQVMVSVNADGNLHEARILQSSGVAVLDEAALRIVRLSAPFAPFAPELRKSTDRLEIVRTWQFRQNRFSRLD